MRDRIKAERLTEEQIINIICSDCKFENKPIDIKPCQACLSRVNKALDAQVAASADLVPAEVKK